MSKRDDYARRKNRIEKPKAVIKSPDISKLINVKITPDHGKPFYIFVKNQSQVEPTRQRVLDRHNAKRFQSFADKRV